MPAPRRTGRTSRLGRGLDAATAPAPLTAARIERESGALAAKALAAMEDELPWFRSMPAEQRSRIGLVAQAGIAAFVEWVRAPGHASGVADGVFSAAPRELARAITLLQTVEMVRVTISVVESEAGRLASPGEEAALREAVLRYSREVAFGAATAYAEAAEERGSWDARLEALVVDSLLRGEADEALPSLAAALGWGGPSTVSVLVGRPPVLPPEAVLDNLRRAARRLDLAVLASVHGDRLVTVLGGAGDPLAAARQLLPAYGEGPVVLGPPGPDLASAAGSAAAALSGARVVAAWPGAPRPVLASDLLPERALDGETEARRLLVDTVYVPLRDADPTLLDTVSTYVEHGGSLEATARALFVHPNTVRYRLRKATDECGRAPTNPRDAFVLRVALALGRLGAAGPPYSL